jgi:hypothetical protein
VDFKIGFCGHYWYVPYTTSDFLNKIYSDILLSEVIYSLPHFLLLFWKWCSYLVVVKILLILERIECVSLRNSDTESIVFLLKDV